MAGPSDSPSQGEVAEERAARASIAALFDQCLQSFQLLAASLQAAPGETIQLGYGNAVKCDNEFGRFNVWGEQSGANLPARTRGSLDDTLRVRDDAKALVVSVLFRLDAVLRQALPYSQRTDDERESDFESRSSSDSSEDGDTPQRVPRISILLQQVKDQIDSLFELSSVLGRPAFHGRWDRSTATEESVLGQAFVEFDRRHVLEKIRHWRGLGKDQNATLMEEDTTEDDLTRKDDLVPWLCDRLALANSKRRSQLQYWSENPCQLAQGPEERVGEEETNEVSTGLETINTAQKEGLELATGGQTLSMLAPSVDYTSTDDGRSQSTQDSNTAYRQGSNRVPDAPMPSNGAHASCPYCGVELQNETVEKRKSWRQHVFRDLTPYLCTFEDCQSPDRQFTSRRNWAYHELQMHRRQYVCKTCSGAFSDEQALSEHLISAHRDAFTDDQIPAAVRLCNRPEDEDNEQTCVVCERKMTLADLQSHLAAHMEDLALFVLPLAMEDEEAGSEASNHVIAEEGHSINPADSKIAFDDTQERIGESGHPIESIFQLEKIESLTVAEKMESWDTDEPFVMPTVKAIPEKRSPTEEPPPPAQQPEHGTDRSLEQEAGSKQPQQRRMFDEDAGEPQSPLLSSVISVTDSDKTRETDMPARYDIPDEAEEGVWGYLFPLFGDDGSGQRIKLKASTSQDQGGLQSSAPSSKGAPELDPYRSGLPKGGYLMGRHTGCDAVMTGLSISNRHCVIYTKATKNRSVAVVMDMSSNGTFINEAIIGRNQRRDLQDRDMISITPKHRYVFRYPENIQDKGTASRQEYAVLEKLGKGRFAPSAASIDPAMIENFHTASDHFQNLLRSAMSQGQIINPAGNDDELYQPKTFLRSGAARKILNEQNLREKVIGFVVHRGKSPSQVDRDLGKIHGSPGLCAILLCILTMGTPEMILCFAEQFLGERPCGKTDDDLPFDGYLARQLFGSEGGTTFFRKQFAFVAVMLEMERFDHEFESLSCLPYLENERIGNATYGKIYRVKIEKGHFLFREPRSRNKDPVFLARKDFDLNDVAYRAFEDEERTLRELINSSDCPPNIMTSICSTVCTTDWGTRPASIFFPPVIGDLSNYINNDDNKPSSHIDRFRHVRQMLGLCHALEWLAKNLAYKKDNDRNSYHYLDLKPENVLVCEDHTAGLGRPVTFKIGDFRQTQEVQHTMLMEGNKRKQHRGTYRAPEIQGDKPWQEVKSNSDVWSFGCLFLLIVIFNYQGADGIAHFSEARRRELKDSDQFCNPNSQRSDVCNPAVTRYLDVYINNQIDGLEIHDAITLESLKYLQKSVLARSSRRHGAAKVSENLHSIYNQARFTPEDVITHSNVPSDATHCGHSPDGMVFFSSPTKVVLWDDLPDIEEIHPLAIKSRWSTILQPTSTSCSRLSLCIVLKGPNDFDCVFHDIRSPGHLPKMVQLTDIGSPVDKIAVSPDGSMFAIACGPFNGRPACIRLYQFDTIERPDFASHGRALSMSASSAGTKITTASDPRHPFERRIDPLFDSTKFLVDLCFSGDSNVLYCAYRYTTWNGTLEVGVTMWDMTTCSKIGFCTIMDTDTLDQLPLLTSVVPFNSRMGFLCVTDQLSIVKHRWNGDSKNYGVFRIPDAKWLRTVIISSDDEKVVILATPDGSAVEIYGALVSDIAKAKKLAISTKIRYDPMYDTAFIRESGNCMEICITSLEDKQTYSFDLRYLFDL